VAIAASGEYYSRANLYSRDRADVAGSADLSNDATGLGRGGLNTNSPTYGGRVRVSIGTGSLAAWQLVLVDLANSTPNQTINGTNPNGYREFENLPGEGSTDPSRFNFRDFTPAIPAVEKAMYYVTGRYKVFGDALQFYGDIMYTKSKQDNGLAPSPFTSSQIQATDGTAGLQLIRNSPWNPFFTGGVGTPARPVLNQLRYRFHPDEIGNRRSFFDRDYYRYVAGANGDFIIKDNGFISHLGYDSGFVYERLDQQRIDTGDATGTALGDEIEAGNFNPFIGQFAPVRGLAPTFTNGVPNVDPVTGAPVLRAYDNAAAAQRASYLGHSFFYERDWLVDAKINAHLFPTLWNGGIDIALGYEHREVQTHTVPDPVQAAGDQLGFNAASNTKFRQETDSYFGELTLPIINSTMNIPFVRSLEIGAAYRFEEFDNFDLFHSNPAVDHITFDNGGTPRVTLRYQPTADITLRASWNQSFRSPQPADLFDPGEQNFPQVFDPLKAVVLQPTGGVRQIGNPDLQPEQTDTWSAGIVWTPKFLPGFTMTADWYQIFTTDLILDNVSFAQIMLTANGLSALANNGEPTLFVSNGPAVQGVVRDQAGNVASIQQAETNNAGRRFVQGLDMTATYEIPTERFGKFTLTGAWNHFFTWKVEGDPALAPGFTNFLGNYNNGTQPLAPGAIPFNKGFLRGEWQWKGFDFVATGNYVGDFEDDPAFILGNTVLGGTIANPDFREHHRVSEYTTLDMQLSYEWVKPTIEAAPTYAKESKDGKGAMQTAAETSSIWQRMLWGTKSPPA